MPESVETLLEKADYLLLGGDAPDALDVLAAALQAAPDDPRPYARRAEIRVSLGESAAVDSGGPMLRQAVADLDRAVALGLDTAALRFLRLRALAALDDLPAARAAYDEALALDPDNGRLREWGVRLAIRAGDLTQARRLVGAELAAAPGSFHWGRWQADLLLHGGDDAGACDAFTALLESHAPAEPPPGAGLPAALNDPRAWQAVNWGDLLLKRAEARRRLADFAGALADLAAAAVYLPDDPTVAFGRGLIAWGQGDIDGAFDLLRAGLAAAGPEVRAGFWAALDGYPRRDELSANINGEQT